VNKQPPAISKDVKLPAALNGMEKLNLHAEANVSFLQGLLKAFSSNASAGFSLDDKNNINFKLDNPRTNFIDIIKLDAFIQDAKINTDAKAILERLKNDDLYVITEIIKANSFILEEDEQSDLSAKVEVPLKQVVDAKGGVEVKKEKSRKIENTDGTYFTIAIKAFQILYDKPSLFSSRPAGFRIREATNIKIFRGEEAYPAKPLEDVIVNLQDATI
jgi:hypothetical protein